MFTYSYIQVKLNLKTINCIIKLLIIAFFVYNRNETVLHDACN